jgi:hypothetical protein
VQIEILHNRCTDGIEPGSLPQAESRGAVPPVMPKPWAAKITKKGRKRKRQSCFAFLCGHFFAASAVRGFSSA